MHQQMHQKYVRIGFFWGRFVSRARIGIPWTATAAKLGISSIGFRRRESVTMTDSHGKSMMASRADHDITFRRPSNQAARRKATKQQA